MSHIVYYYFKIMIILIALSIFLNIYGSVQSLDCNYGEALICSNLKYAKKCNKVNNCLKLWQNAKVVEFKDDNQCTSCKKIVHTLNYNFTISSKRAEYDYMSNILHKLKYHEDVICPILGFCKHVKIDLPTLKFTNSSCQRCEKFINYIKNMISENKTINEIEDYLEMSVCGILPYSMSIACKDVVKDYTEFIVEQTKAEIIPKELCEVIGFCTILPVKTTAKNKIKKSKLGSGCEICKVFVTYIYSKLEEDMTEKQIKNELKIACEYLPGSMVPMCRSSIDKYTDSVIKHFINEMSPLSVCEAFGLCKTESLLIVPTKRPLLGSNPCTWGPSYWCSSLNNSRTCGMSLHCLMRVWRRRPQQVQQPDCSGDLQVLCSDPSHTLCGPEVVNNCLHNSTICQDDYKLLCASTFLTELCKLQARCAVEE